MEKIDLELEKNILCSCLLDRQALMLAAEIVGWVDFQKPEHQTLFRGLLDIPADCFWDVLHIGQDLRDRQKIGKAISGEILLEIAQASFGTANTVYHCRKLKELSLNRQRQQLIEIQAKDPMESGLFQAELEKISLSLETLKAKPDSISLQVCELIEAGIEGKRQVISTPWRRLDLLAMFLLAGTVVLFCGNVGACKSFMVLQLCAHLIGLGVRFAIWELEENTAFHVLRALAQYTNSADLTNPDWQKSNPNIARAAYLENTDFINTLGGSMTDSPDSQPTLGQVSFWVERQARSGCRVIIIDPITLAAHTMRETWQEDQSFVDAIKKTAARHGCTIILVTHPVKAVSMPDVSQLAGGVTYSRACQTIVWLQSHEPQKSDILTACGTDEIEHSRTLHILKARNGSGQGKRLAFELNKENLTLTEVGIIGKKRTIKND